MGLLISLIRELAISPDAADELESRRKRWQRDMYSPGSSGAVDFVPTKGPAAAGGQGGGTAATPQGGAAAGAAGGTVSGTTSGGQAARMPAGSSYSSVAIQTMRNGGWSDAAIKSALAAGIGEGGFDREWAPSSVPGEKSFGHWQLNDGGRLPDYQKFAGNATDTASQTKFMMHTMEKLHPGFGKIDDPTLGVQLFHDKFKDYGASPAHLPGAEALLNQHNQTMQSGGSATASSAAPSSGSSLARYATGNARMGGASSVEGVHPEFAGRINNMVKAMPPEIASKFNIISGHRSPTRQAQVNPGVTNSHHAPGMAVDTTWDSDVRNWITQNGNKFGVGYTIAHLPNEGNHLEPTENGQRVQPSQMKQWAQSHMPSSSSSNTQLASKSGSKSSGSSSGGIGSTLSNAMSSIGSSIGSAIMPSAHAATMPDQPTSGVPSTATQQQATATPPPQPPIQNTPPQQPPPQVPVAAVQSNPPSGVLPQQIASALPPDKIPRIESVIRPAIYLIRPLNNSRVY